MLCPRGVDALRGRLRGFGQSGARVFTLARGLLGGYDCVRRVLVWVGVVSGTPLDKLGTFSAEISANSIHVVARCARAKAPIVIDRNSLRLVRPDPTKFVVSLVSISANPRNIETKSPTKLILMQNDSSCVVHVVSLSCVLVSDNTQRSRWTARGGWLGFCNLGYNSLGYP